MHKLYTSKLPEPVIEKPSTIITEKPSTIITGQETPIIPEKPSTIIINEIPNEQTTIILENKCLNESKLSEACGNLTNQELYNGILEEVLSRFPPFLERKDIISK